MNTPQRTITTTQRFGVWKAWNGRCFWCREPVPYKDCNIDHVIPLAAVVDGQAYEVRANYGLAPDFDFDSFGNWVPAHLGCNSSKGTTLVDPSPAFALHLTQVQSRVASARMIAENVARDVKKASVLARIEVALNRGDIAKEDIEALFAGLPRIESKKSGSLLTLVTTDSLHIAPGWDVIESDGHLRVVRTKSGRVGMTSLSRDPSWTCSYCGNKGPWNGIICLSCGNRDAPD
jgi:hypothetical protein